MKLAALIPGALLVLVGCQPAAPRAIPPVLPAAAATPSAEAPAEPARVAVQAVQPLPSVVPRPVASPSPLALPLSVLAGRNGADLRVALDLLLQENAFLAASAVDAASSARLDELIGVSSVLDQNSLTLAEIVGVAKGKPAAQALADAWRGQLEDVVSSAQGQQQAASASLSSRQVGIGNLLAVGELSATAAADLLQHRFQLELNVADAAVSRDASRFSAAREALAAASDELARPLAAALASRLPDLPPPGTTGLDVDLRLRLTSDLQRHVYLIGAAIDAASDNRSADLQAALDASSRVDQDFGEQLASVYGSDVASAVSDRLSRQTRDFVMVASGGDRRQAASDIDQLRAEMDARLAGANSLLPPDLVGQQLRASDQALLTGADAFAAHDPTTAFMRLREAARQSQKPAETLALAMVDRYPGRYLTLPTLAPAPPSPDATPTTPE